jgi:hypothetical protein
MPRCAEHPKESSTAHAKVEVAIATFLKFDCVMDLTPLFFAYFFNNAPSRSEGNQD